MSKKLTFLAFNLLPKKTRRKAIFKKDDRALIIILIVLLLVIGGVYYFQHSLNNQLKDQIAFTDLEIDKYQVVREQTTNLERNIASIGRIEASMVKLQKESTSLRWVFLELEKVTPAGVSLAGLNIDRGAKNISFQVSAANIMRSTEFLVRVRQANFVTSFQVQGISIDVNTGRIAFPMTIIFKEGV